MGRIIFLLNLSVWSILAFADDQASKAEKDESKLLKVSPKLDLPKTTIELTKSMLKTAKETLGINQAKAWKTRTTQSLALVSVIKDFSDHEKVWDAEEALNSAWMLTSVGLWVAGYSIPHLWIPSALYAAYKIPPVKSTVDENLYGSYLTGVRNIFDESEFTNKNLINSPYLICNLYENEKDLANGNKPQYWNYINQEDDFKNLPSDNFSKDNFYQPYTYKRVSKHFFVVPGRWVKIPNGYWDYHVRFASIAHPVDLQLICNEHMIRNKKIEKPEDEKRVVPQVGYSNMTQSYPIYFYTLMNLRQENGDQIRLAKRLTIDNTVEQKMQNESRDYLDELMRSIQPTRFLHAGLSRSEHGREVWKPDMVGGKWDLVGEIDTPYQIYKTIRKYYQTGYKPSENELLGLGLKTIASGETIYKALTDVKYIPYVGYVHHTRAFYYMVNAMILLSPHIYSFATNSVVTEKIFGDYLQENTSFSLDEFQDQKLNTAYLQCNYYENDKALNAQKSLYWGWSQASALIKGTDKIPSYAEKKDQHILLKGRWVKIVNPKSKEIYFAFSTLEDPIRLLATCQKSLAYDYEDGLLSSEQKKKVGYHTLVTVGLTKYTHKYPLLYYLPYRSQEHTTSKTHDTVKLFLPDFEKIEKSMEIFSHNSAHELEQNALNEMGKEKHGIE